MSNFIKKLFGTLIQKPWEKEQAEIDNYHEGRTFNISSQKSAVIVIFGVATVLFSLIFTGYLYTLPPEQDTRYLLKPNLLWINTIVLFFVTYYFSKVTNDLKKRQTSKVKKKSYFCWCSKLLIFIWPSNFLVSINEKWKLCINQFLFFIILFFYCIAWHAPFRWIVFLGKSFF